MPVPVRECIPTLSYGSCRPIVTGPAASWLLLPRWTQQYRPPSVTALNLKESSPQRASWQRVGFPSTRLVNVQPLVLDPDLLGFSTPGPCRRGDVCHRRRCLPKGHLTAPLHPLPHLLPSLLREDGHGPFWQGPSVLQVRGKVGNSFPVAPHSLITRVSLTASFGNVPIH